MLAGDHRRSRYRVSAAPRSWQPAGCIMVGALPAPRAELAKTFHNPLLFSWPTYLIPEFTEFQNSNKNAAMHYNMMLSSGKSAQTS